MSQTKQVVQPLHLVTGQTGDESKTEQLSLSQPRVNEVLTVWPQVVPYLEKALSFGQGDETTKEHVLAALLREDSFMWVAHDETEVYGAMIMRILDMDTCRKIWIDFVLGKEMSRWIDQMEQALVKCKEIVGAECVEGSCRPGIARILERRGHKKKAIIMEFNP